MPIFNEKIRASIHTNINNKYITHISNYNARKDTNSGVYWAIYGTVLLGRKTSQIVLWIQCTFRLAKTKL